MTKKELNDRVMRAIQQDNLSEVKYLVSMGADDGVSAFYAADYLDRKEIASFLIDHFNLNADELEQALQNSYRS